MTALHRYIQAGFYLFAGLNHFINPDFYLDLIPAYLGEPEFINVVAGLAELILGAGLLLKNTRRVAAFGIMAMLLAFIPSHVYFIQLGSCIPDGLCVPEWVGWSRLAIIHPLLIYWAWIVAKSSSNHSV